ncbi:MAG: methanogenesis marker 16 metalloprotein [Methanocorpusculum sp.]|nr:methanogenesis marker 16 metalloprotein [Methanocorpusculum sp.]
MKNVITASELKSRVRSGNAPKLGEIDAVTCGTFGVMSGTAAIFSFAAAAPGTFNRAETVYLNGVPATVGPCPNENNGFIDCIVNGTSVSRNNRRYSGGHLFADMAAGKTIIIEVKTDNGILTLSRNVRDFSTARLIVTRGAFKNYTAFVNRSSEDVKSIFSVLPFSPLGAVATFSGCGEINPLENDPTLRFHSPGTRVLVNGAPGVLLGCGTRSSPEHPNLSAAADIAEMDSDLMGGFSFADSAECLTSIATAIPLEDSAALAAASVLDEDIALPVADVSDRIPFTSSTYSNAWAGDLRPVSHPENCTNTCKVCAAAVCPRSAITDERTITSACMGCMTCTVVCLHNVFTGDAGALRAADGSRYRITLRQSDRIRGERAALRLKELIVSGEWRG